MGHSIRKVQGLSGIEALNGSTPMHHNLHAYSLAAELSIPALGASDAHTVDKIGRYATEFQGIIRDTRDFIEAVRQGGIGPVMHTGTGYESFNPYSRKTRSILMNTFTQDLVSIA